MPKKKDSVKKERSLLLDVLKLPFTIARKSKQQSEKRRVRKKREAMTANYEDFDVVSVHDGDFKQWEESVMHAESKIGIILGARGTGKSAFGIKFLENIHAQTRKQCYAMGFKREEMPSWISVVEDVSEIKNNGLVLIDEGGILFSSRKSMSNANKLLSDLILVARHKNLSILFISQNSSNLDVNILRQADFLVLKPTSLLQKDFERKKIQQIYKDVAEEFSHHKSDRGIAHVYADGFRGFVSNPLPSFWSVKLSKSFG